MKKYIIGVDIGGTHTKVAVLGLSGRILYKTDFLTRDYKREGLIHSTALPSARLGMVRPSTSSGRMVSQPNHRVSPERTSGLGRARVKGLIKAISDTVGIILEKKNIKKREVLGLGVGLPGLVDFKKGLVFCLTNVPGWGNVPLKKILEHNTGMPVFIDNDVKVMAMGELRRGAGRGYKNVICMTLGTGVGGAVIIDGNLYRGASLVAGEIGHISINEEGPVCNCGNSGCLEAYVGREYFLNDVRKRMGYKGNIMPFTPEYLSEAAAKGNKIAAAAWQKIGERIGSVLAGVVNLLNPEIIIIGGGMAGAGEILFGSIRNTVSKRSLRIPWRAVKIVKAKLGNDAALIGAGEMVKDNLVVSHQLSR